MLLCPVCSGTTTRFATYSADDVVLRIEHALGQPGLQEHVHSCYEMFRCSACTLEFANPMIETGAGFYQWLTRSGFAYPEKRWEWSACRDWINVNFIPENGSDFTVLDVGCGDGRFLELLSKTEAVRATGVDLNPDVILTCRSKGLEACLGGLDTISDAVKQPVDMVTLWHVVEHIADPLKVLTDAKSILSSKGVICFSVPLSPMSYEAAWPDPFNAPPHHLTRWNERSLNALAVALHMDMELILPEPDSALRRATRALLLQAGTARPSLGWFRKLGMLLRLLRRNPCLFLVELRRQRSAPTIAGRARPDVALIVLKRK